MERPVDEFRSSTRRWLLGSFAGWGTLLACLAGVGFVIIGVRWLKNRSTSYEITDQRLIIKRGILFKTTDEIELYRIKDVRLGYSLLNQMTDIGTIILTSSDRTTAGGEFTLRDIPMARDRREGLRKLVDRARQRRGVRELDVEDAYALD
ncbi:PH domain-containing protein [Sphingomonas faeni]|uniref:PH domain-containing protein n=1 Tax=Sphingomonas faeni TaxID=185950 RepID=UPI0027846D1E|nr:PH domain-containing protein [Sphingomonas faeni]MDQ0838762.1 putative membrane protein YdbT with pleckstrin-like domain [Sphingomonas faeni]